MMRVFSCTLFFLLTAFRGEASLEEDRPSLPSFSPIVSSDEAILLNKVELVQDAVEDSPLLNPTTIKDIPVEVLALTLEYLDENSIEKFGKSFKRARSALRYASICKFRFERWQDKLPQNTFLTSVLKLAFQKAWGNPIFCEEVYRRYHEIRFFHHMLSEGLVHGKTAVTNAFSIEKFGKDFTKSKGMGHLKLETLFKRTTEGGKSFTARCNYFDRLGTLSIRNRGQFLIKKAPRMALLGWAESGDPRAQNLLVEYHANMAHFVNIPEEFLGILEYWASLDWEPAQRRIITVQNNNDFTLQMAGLRPVGGTVEDPIFIENPWHPAQEKASTWLLHGTGPYQNTSLEDRLDRLEALAEEDVDAAQNFVARALYEGSLSYGEMNLPNRRIMLESLLREGNWNWAGVYLYKMWKGRIKTGLELPEKYPQTLAKWGVEKAQRSLDSRRKKKYKKFTPTPSDLWSLVDELF